VAAAVVAGESPFAIITREILPNMMSLLVAQVIGSTVYAIGAQVGLEFLGLGDVSLFLFTQLNLRTIEATMRALGQPMSKTHWTMDKWGYTGSACIPMTLDDAAQRGRLKPGDHVVLCATGGGLATAAVLLRWGA